jgi:putative ATPase
MQKDMQFQRPKTNGQQPSEPLAYRMRPRTLEEFVGQEHLVGPGRLLSLAIMEDRLPSAIFYGPPGTGKTSLAGIMAEATGAAFIQLDASGSGVADLRKVLAEARERLQPPGAEPAPRQGNTRMSPGRGPDTGLPPSGTRAGARQTLLFIDEIHRFNKAQQDVLLPAVEKGIIILIGATTENPYFSVNAPLLSRTRVLPFYPLQPQHLRRILERALADAERGLGRLRIEIAPEAVEHWLRVAGGDARILLNALEAAVSITPTAADGAIRIGGDEAAQAVQQRLVLYDRDGDAHYDVVSAFIKSMRGSDPDAVLHWLARMLRAGEDPRFIARRIVICAAEDVGLADPRALVVANAAAQGIEYVGLPEGELLLAEAAVYVACAPKSNRVYRGLTAARQDLEQADIGTVPKHLRDANYRSAKKLGHGADYQYPHNFPGAYVEQQYLPDTLRNRKYYEPSESGQEKDIKLHRAAPKTF